MDLLNSPRHHSFSAAAGELERLGIPYVPAAQVFAKGQITAVPTIVLVDRNGVVQGKRLGSDVARIRQMIMAYQSA